MKKIEILKIDDGKVKRWELGGFKYTLVKFIVLIFVMLSLIGLLTLGSISFFMVFRKDKLYEYVKIASSKEKLKKLETKYKYLQERMERLERVIVGDVEYPNGDESAGSLPIYTNQCDTPCALPAVGPIVRGMHGDDHRGIDIDIPESTFVFSTAKGVVYEVSYNENYGKYVIIKHSKGYKTLYAHLSKVFVKKGDSIKTGQIIGLSGKTGKTTGPHLHYEVYKHKKILDPVMFVQ